MTTVVDIVNQALQSIGTRTTIASLTENSNEAIQASLIYAKARDQLLRMAPWNCATNLANLTLITAQPGTPEFTGAGPTLWQKGLPPPPWVYEYQYPVDCLKPLYVMPQFTSGFSSGIPLTPVSSGATYSWIGPPAKYKVGVDQFYPVTAVAVAAGGTGYAVNDLVTLAAGPVTSTPIGAPLVVLVTAVAGGVITSASVVSIIPDTTSGGSYFAKQTNPVAQGSTTGSGTGATFNLTFGTAQVDQRVILTNQEFASLSYVKQITDPNVMDVEFQEAWQGLIAAKLVMALTGDKQLANAKIQEVNLLISQARKDDANEGLTINDVTPDWIRVRGTSYPSWEVSPNLQFDWGPMFSAY